MLVARAKRNVGDFIVQSLIRILRDAYGVKIRVREQADLFHAVVHVDDFRRVVQVHNTVLGCDVVEEVLVLADVAHKAVVQKIADIQFADLFIPEQFMFRGEKDIGLKAGYALKAKPLVLKIAEHALALGDGEMQDTDFGVAAGHIVHHIHGIGLAEAQEEALPVLMPTGDIVKADRSVRETCHRDHKATALAVGLIDEAVQTVHLFQNNLAVGEETFAVSGEAHALIGALKQIKADFLFYALDDVRKLRLGNIHGLCGLIDGTVAGNTHKIFEIFCIQASLHIRITANGPRNVLNSYHTIKRSPALLN